MLPKAGATRAAGSERRSAQSIPEKIERNVNRWNNSKMLRTVTNLTTVNAEYAQQCVLVDRIR